MSDEPSSADSPSRRGVSPGRRSWKRRLGWGLLAWFPFAVWVVGHSARDANLWTGYCFYTPSPAIAVWLWLLAVLAARRGARRAAVAYAFASLAPAAMVLGVENQWTRPPRVALTEGEASRPIRVVHWNVQWAAGGWDRVVERLRALDADIYFLSEVGESYDYSAFEGYQQARMLSMSVLARGELSEPRRLRAWMSQRVWTVDWRGEAGAMRLMMVDISSFPQLNRHRQLGFILEDLRVERPDLVAGDFNTPRRVRRLTPPPEGYRHAYHEAGAGWSYTWPAPAPIFAIDQLLVGARVVPTRYDLHTTLLSDHRMQVMEMRLRGPAGE